ncbi:ferric reductase-like transmembrane domain-containing protein [Knoellia locipacati]|uniref:Oxidoreductase n=1 Tax=Knoellia locipacati TaxID=882824 RepID=A0A512SVS9_9MICO|nr:ferredoxin reductase family protein [Knoellia locipacati]GEQ12015.1 oxidoreductase [Knoellia locipacati]
MTTISPAATWAQPGPPAPLTATTRRRPATVPLWWRDASGVALWALLVAVTCLWVLHGGVHDLGGLGDGLTSVGRLTGLLASALLLVQVLLMARVPWFEQAWGQDELARTHRLVGFTSFNLMIGHIVLIVLGYAASSDLGLWGTTWDLVVNYPGMLLAVAGTGALVMVVVTSVKKARARLRYESWHLIHLYGYLGAGLALPHQLWTGRDFTASPVSTWLWWSLYAVAAGAVLVFRVGVPVVRSLRAPLRVSEVRHDAADVTTVTVTGPGVERLAAHGGQFFQWRFLDGPGWTRAHPYSLSAAPDGRSLRFTAAHVGDGTERLASLRAGTRVLVEGPYGRLHQGVRTRRKVLLMGSGIGITPMRALLEDLDHEPGDVTVIHRVRDTGSAVLADEIAALADERGGRYLLVAGPRVPGRDTWLPVAAEHLSDADALRHLVPDVADHDVFLCGSPGWMEAARAAAISAGVPEEHVHLERFSY